MKEQIIEIMKYAGYNFIEEKPEGRLLFYEAEEEQTVQLWLKEGDESLKAAVTLIRNRAYDNGFTAGQSNVRYAIRRALDIE